MIKPGYRNSPHCRPTAVTALILALLIVTGCKQDPELKDEQNAAAEKARPVRVIVVDDAPLADAVQRQWSARTQSGLELKQMSSDDLNKLRRLNADIIIYPSACLGTLAANNLIAPPSDTREGDEEGQAGVFPVQRNSEVRWGNENYAFSFGSPQFVLMYRADLFAQLEIEPPTTWQEYQELLERLQRNALGDAAPAADQAWAATCEPLAPGWAGNTLLARAASYASHPSQFSVLFDYSTMEPLIDGPPFARALTELIAANQQAGEGAKELTPESARRRFYAGEVAMTLSWPCRATIGSENWELAEGVEVGFADLPGSTVAYNFDEQRWTNRDSVDPVCVPLIGFAGRLGSVAENARRPRDAAQLLALLTGKEWSERLSPISAATTLFRESHAKTPQLWTDSVLPLDASEQYAELVQETQSKPAQVSSVRIPGWKRYLSALDQAVVAALDGSKSPEEALSETAKSWTSITEELGLDTQREAYTRSLGLEP